MKDFFDQEIGAMQEVSERLIRISAEILNSDDISEYKKDELRASITKFMQAGNKKSSLVTGLPKSWMLNYFGCTEDTLRAFLENSRDTTDHTIIEIAKSAENIVRMGLRASTAKTRTAYIKVDNSDRFALRKEMILEEMREIRDMLDSAVPEELMEDKSNMYAIKISPNDFSRMYATLFSAEKFLEVNKWDDNIIDIIRSLVSIINEMDILGSGLITSSR